MYLDERATRLSVATLHHLAANNSGACSSAFPTTSLSTDYALKWRRLTCHSPSSSLSTSLSYMPMPLCGPLRAPSCLK
jgi:hypothetical protein